MRDADAARSIVLRQYSTLTQEQFRQICEEKGPSEPKYLLIYLHNAGTVFYQQGLFNDSIVLDQSSVLDAIYTVFNRRKCYEFLLQEGGRFRRSLLELLVWQDNSQREQMLFLSMIQSCGVCFRLKPGDAGFGIETVYVAPDLLPEKTKLQEQLDNEWDVANAVEETTFEYALLNQGFPRDHFPDRPRGWD
jgi:internalin A